jgi:hypothetical protein
MPAWLPILQQYGTGLLQQCQNQMALSEELVSQWLRDYMFRADEDRVEHARDVAHQLNNHTLWKSHARRVGLHWLRDEALLRVIDLGTLPELHEAVRSLHLALSITFAASGAYKIVENARGDALIGVAQTAMVIQGPIQLPPPQPSEPNA